MLEIENTIDISSGELLAIKAPPDVAVELICSLKYNNSDGGSLLYVSGNSSVVLPRFNRIKIDFEVRRSFTVYQLMQIVEEAHQSVIFIEYDIELWEDIPSWSSTEIVGGLVRRMKELNQQGASVIIYSLRMDALDSISKYVDRFINVDYMDRGFSVQDSGVESVKLVNNQNRSLSDFYG